MYLPSHFEVRDEATLGTLMAAHPLATVVHHDAEGGLAADPLPLLHDAASRTLLGHVARANPLARAAAGSAVLAIFQGPDAYVSPSAYPSKVETHKVVPTWNYVVVQAHGRLVLHDDDAWLAALLARLTARHEAGRPVPWAMSDAPPAYIEAMLRAVVGVEIVIDRLAGKWKASQNRSAADRTGVVEALGPHPMAAVVREPPG